jgi:hypothetical protein
MLNFIICSNVGQHLLQAGVNLAIFLDYFRQNRFCLFHKWQCF